MNDEIKRAVNLLYDQPLDNTIMITYAIERQKYVIERSDSFGDWGASFDKEFIDNIVRIKTMQDVINNICKESCNIDKDRLITIIHNLIILIDEGTMGEFLLGQKIDLLKEEIGLTDKEIKELDIINKCLD